MFYTECALYMYYVCRTFFIEIVLLRTVKQFLLFTPISDTYRIDFFHLMQYVLILSFSWPTPVPTMFLIEDLSVNILANYARPLYNHSCKKNVDKAAEYFPTPPTSRIIRL